MKRKYDTPLCEVEKLTIIQSICVSYVGEGAVPGVGGGDPGWGEGGGGEGQVPGVGGGEGDGWGL